MQKITNDIIIICVGHRYGLSKTSNKKEKKKKQIGLLPGCFERLSSGTIPGESRVGVSAGRLHIFPILFNIQVPTGATRIYFRDEWVDGW